MGNLEIVYIKLRNDAEFKAAFQQNPKKALTDAGIELSQKELEMVLEQTKLSDDGLLSGRINK